MNSARRYIILTTFEHPHIVAAVLSLRGITASVVPTEYGAVVVRDIPVKEFDDWDISELLGKHRVMTIPLNLPISQNLWLRYFPSYRRTELS